jgi:hypothetical protein
MACGDACPYVPTRVESWEIPDPAGRPIEEVREIRDLIEHHVEQLIETRLAEIYADRTAHSLRLTRLLPGLVEDFEGLRSAVEIRACADAVLEDFDDAPVRSFALLLARRATSECLRRDVCDRISESAA